ncbi:MAG TPA: LamB/YcsF family protein, partial [Actinobacteria bacterium]|nr:LamB/YcsF family protein [Actinomycetota bacterium]
NDRAGFGRESNGVSMEVLKEQLIEQIATLDEIAQASGSAVTYVKAHGQLYHQACVPGSVEAQTIIDAVRDYRRQTDRQLAILGFAGSDLIKRAQDEHLKTANEAFADRSYTPEGWLVARTEPGALITDPTEALVRLKRLLRDREIVAIDGTPIDVRADSICIHGDTPGAVVLARRVRAAIDSDRVKIAPFAPPPRAA